MIFYEDRAIRPAIMLWFAIVLAPSVVAAGPATLVRWAGEGVVIPGRGGEDLIRLVAEARWGRDRAIGPGRYALRVRLPDGRIVDRAFAVETPPGHSRVDVLIPAAAVRDRLPGAVRVGVVVVDAATGAAASNVLEAGIEAFPRPRGEAREADTRPFGWASAMAGEARVLPRPGPDGTRFARVVGKEGAPGFFIATAEASNRQVAARLPGYDPRAGRSDEFVLDAPDQPAIGLTPVRARAYLTALGEADPLRLAYRLPTRDEWLRAARSGRPGAFWWGDDPAHPAGANFLGPEPGLAGDATAPVDDATRYAANPAGLMHAFGNVDEWATRPGGGFVRMGGHFRTEPAPAPSEVAVEGDQAVGPDPFVGVRPVLDLARDDAVGLIRRALAPVPALRGVAISFDPETATAVARGPVPDVAARREADARLAPLWFVATFRNELEPPVEPPGRLARLGPPREAPRRVGSLGRSSVEVALPVAWSDPLPVAGSAWWVNVYLPGGRHVAHRLVEGEAARSRRVAARVDAALWPVDSAPSPAVALSLGSPAPTPDDPRVVSNLAPVRPAAR